METQTVLLFGQVGMLIMISRRLGVGLKCRETSHGKRDDCYD
jgi:hypothetical protein